ncbi:MAG: hypothetical protein ACJAXW_001978 [Candidatus Azotimanducaceae bacterium]|jgi:hypothetical protein
MTMVKNSRFRAPTAKTLEAKSYFTHRYHELEYVSACKALDMDILVIGEEWGSKHYKIAVESYLKSRGKQIIQVRYYSPRT